MFTNFIQKVGQNVRNFLPVETVIVFLLLGVLVWPLPYFGAVSPVLGLVGIYYWSIYRPDLLRPWAVFVLGLFNDALNGLPLGLSACAYLGVYQLAFAHRRFFVRQIFYMLWFGFAVLSFLAFLFAWVVLSVKDQNLVPVIPLVIQYVLTLCLFPLPVWVLNRLQHIFLSQG